MRRLALPRQQPIIGGTLIGDSGLKRQSKDLSRWLVLLPLCSFVAGCLLANSGKSLFQLDQEMIRRTASTDTIASHRVLQDSSENNVTDDIILDMLSMGSKTRPDYYRTQHLIYTTHPAVRNFMVMTEANDTESTCATDLTKEHIDQICAHCRNKDRFWGIPKGEYSFIRPRADMYLSNETINSLANPIGWLCAQKRTIDGLVHMLTTYKNSPIPDYLVVMDDDTWINVPAFLDTLETLYPADHAFFVAGCRINLKKEQKNFKFPYGGWSYVFTRPVLQGLLQPRTCKDKHKDQDFCAQLALNAAGERDLFVDGMSILDLMKAYAFHQRMVDVASWDRAGYCVYNEYVGSPLQCMHNFGNVNLTLFLDLIQKQLVTLLLCAILLPGRAHPTLRRRAHAQLEPRSRTGLRRTFHVPW